MAIDVVVAAPAVAAAHHAAAAPATLAVDAAAAVTATLLLAYDYELNVMHSKNAPQPPLQLLL